MNASNWMGLTVGLVIVAIVSCYRCVRFNKAANKVNRSRTLLAKPATITSTTDVKLWIRQLDQYLQQEQMQKDEENVEVLLDVLDKQHREMVNQATVCKPKDQKYAVMTAYLSELYTRQQKDQDFDLHVFLSRKQEE